VKIALSIIVVILSFTQLNAQNIKALEDSLDTSYGKQKLLILHKLTGLSLQSDPRKAVRYAKQAQDLADNIIAPSNTNIQKSDYYLKPLSHVWAGRAYFEREQYLEAKRAFELAQAEANKIDYTESDPLIGEYLEQIDAIAQRDKKAVEGNFFKRNLGNLGIGEVISETTDEVNISATVKMAESNEKAGYYAKAIENYQKAINLLRDKGNSQQITEIRTHIGDIYKQQNKLEDALDYYVLAKDDYLRANDSSGVLRAQSKIDNVQNIKEARKVIETSVSDNLTTYDPQPKKEAKAGEDPQQQTQDEIKRIAEQLEEEKDYKKSLEYYKLYTELQDKYAEEERQKELALLDQERVNQEITLLRQDQEIKELRLTQSEINLQKQTRFRNNLAIGSVFLLVVAFALYYLYQSKKRDHSKLQVAYNDLDIARNKLADAEKRIKNLLNQQVSGAVAQALLTEEITDKIERKFVCIMFLDIRNFTPFAETKAPEEIIQFQNDVFGFMIDIVQQNNGIINQLLGDGFMATFGAPVSSGNDCDNAVHAALMIIETLNEKANTGKIPETNIGIGLHAGYVVAGNVGTVDRKQYSITGNTVIIAARIEQLNKELGTKILISKDVYDHMSAKNGESTDFKEVHIKGRKEPVQVLSLI